MTGPIPIDTFTRAAARLFAVAVLLVLGAIVPTNAIAAIPTNTELPEVVGPPYQGATVSCGEGIWTEDPTSWGFKWTADGVEITDETASTHQLTEALGTEIRCIVTAYNVDGDASATSEFVVVIAPPAPTNTAPPTVIGSPEPGLEVMCDPGTWTGWPWYEIQWTANGAPIAGETDTNYTIVDAVGVNLRCGVTAINAGGSDSVTSAPAPVIPLQLPANTNPPAIFGSSDQGSLLTCVEGNWSSMPAPDYTFEWTANGSPISGETAFTYIIDEAPGTDIACEVTATNTTGSTTAATAPITVTEVFIPVNDVPPSVTGDPVVANTVVCDRGLWSGSTTVDTVAWLADGSPIAGATDWSYAIAEAAGVQLSCRVTATNYAGGVTATSAAVTVVALAPPVMTVPPSITSSGEVGTDATCEYGTWDNWPTGYTYRWFADGSEISGADQQIYPIAVADGVDLTCEVTATNDAGSDVELSAPITTIPLAPPTNTWPPDLYGIFDEGSEVSCTDGSWSSAPTSFTYAWRADGVTIPGETDNTLTIGEPAGTILTCVVTAINGAGSASQESGPQTVVPFGTSTLPQNLTLPVISGTPTFGATLSCTSGTWTYTPFAYGYQWLADGVPIDGEITPTHVVSEAPDVVLGCIVTAINSSGSTTAAESTITVTVSTAPPVNDTLPLLTGGTLAGDALSCSTGTWGNTPDTFTYAWTADGTPISGETDDTYVIAESLGTSIACVVTATNTFGSTSATSDPVDVTAPPVPVNTAPPSVTGDTGTGSTLTCDTGSWAPAPQSFAFVWLADGAPIADADMSTYDIQEDAGVTIECVVTATDTGGSTSATSNAIVVTMVAPTALVPPTISGVPTAGGLLACNTGTWTGSPSSLVIQWTADGIDLPGEDGPSYTIVESIGTEIHCVVTATNVIGTTVVSSSPAIVAAPAPVVLDLPTIDGTPIPGGLLTCDPGTWANDPDSFAFQWTLWGLPIDGADSDTYVVGGTTGDEIRCEVTATNEVGSSVAISDPTIEGPPPPVNTVLPTIDGTYQPGNVLTCLPGTWTGDPTGFTFIWLADGVPIPGEVSNEYTVTEGVGTNITCDVTATNASGSGVAMSEPIVVQPFVPSNVTPPTITGFSTPGSTVICEPGTWSDNPTSYEFVWTADGIAIPGAVSDEYTIVDGVGTELRCVVTAENASGSSAETSAPVTVTPEMPAAVTIPVISGARTPGATLTCTNGTWSGNPTLFSVQWLASGDPIPGAISTTYVIAEAVGTGISCEVTADNGSGTGTAQADSVTVLPFAPTNTTLPAIDGGTLQGAIVNCDPGTWTDDPTGYDYAWTADGVAIPDQEHYTYEITAPVGALVRCVVTARNDGGAATATSAAITITPFAPTNVVEPAISGVTTPGSTLTCAPGSWTGTPDNYAFQWHADGSPISGADQSTHVVIELVDTTLSCEVTATNVTGTANATSGGVVITATPTAPSNTSAPRIIGSTIIGSTVTCDPGVWTGSPTAYAYEWLADGTPVAGEVDDSYVISDAVGVALVCSVTATNASGDTAETSSSVTVAPVVPTSTAPPEVSGSAAPGSTLTCSTGTWTGSPILDVEWRADGDDIPGETNTTYVIAEAGGTDITCAVTATNVSGATTAVSNAITVTVSAPTNAAPPSITGGTTSGSTLTCANGTWNNNPTSFTYAWTGNGAPLGASTSTYVIAQPVGTLIRCQVTALNSAGSASTTSSPVTVTAAPTAPTNTAVPAVTGSAVVGEELECSDGTWTGNPTTYTHAWTADGVAIPGEDTSTYTITAPAGTVVRCVVTAQNGVGSTTATSASVTVLPLPPANTDAPDLTGSTPIGSTLSCTTGSWSPVPTAYAYSWFADGVQIAGQTGSTYVIATAGGAVIECVVTASNAGGSTSATSNPITSQQAVPTNTVSPSISGSTTSGDLLSCDYGSWTGSPSYAVAWTADGVPIAGAELDEYEIAEPVGTLIRCVVTAENSGGSATATSSAVTVTATPVAPTNSLAPQLTGSATSGSTLTCSDGTWTGTPSIEHAWLADGVEIAGETSASYTIAVAVGVDVRCVVTATNVAGSTVAMSTVVTVAAPLPTNTTAPVVSGSTTAGSTLTCTNGTWTASPSGYSRVWTANGVALAQTAPTYVIAVAPGTAIACEVTATNASGAATATSNTVTVTEPAPTSSALPTLTGGTTAGSTLTCSPGTWTNDPDTLSFAWTANGVLIAGATADEYVIAQAAGVQLRCVVDAENTGGSATATSGAVTVTGSPTAPTNTALPTISGSAIEGATLTCDDGSWTGTPSSFARSWTADGVALVGETAGTYVISESAGTAIRCVVTATNGVGSTTSTSDPTTVLPPAPTNVTAPVVAGSSEIGATLTCSAGSWTPTPTSYDYVWTADGVAIGGEASSTYVIGVAVGIDVGCSVTATTGGGSTTIASSNVVTVTPPPAPANTVAPTISGNRWLGATLTCAPGSWSPAGTSYAYAWMADGAPIVGATTSSHVVAAAIGTNIACAVTATNPGGSATATSVPVSVTVPPAPTNTTLPVATGLTTIGETLTCTPGSWTANPTSYSYQWTANGTPISGQTSSTYSVTGPAGTLLRCVVQAINAGGTSAAATSAARTVTTTPAPTNTSLPVLTGNSFTGGMVTCSQGTWFASPTSYTRVWTLDGVVVSGATGTLFTVQSTHAVGAQLRCVVTATNAAGSVSATSAPLAIAMVPAPANGTLPVVVGRRAPGAVVTCSPGSWSPAATSYTYAWSAAGVPIAGATSATYTITQAIGTNLTCTVTATNAGGSASATSAAVPVTVNVATNVTAPTLTGDTVTGSVLACSPGSWTESPTISYAWLVNGATRSGMNGSTYTITESEGTTIRCDVIATTAGGAVRRTAGTISVQAELARTLSATVLPSIRTLAGKPAGAYVGGIVRCAVGGWSTSATPTYAFGWTLNGAAIAGATDSQIVVPAGSARKQLVCTVTASADGATGTAPSAAVKVAAYNVINGTSRTRIPDSITGTSGSDKIVLRAGNDTGRGLVGDDWILGDAGNDLLYGWTGNDRLHGGTGNDRVYGGSGNDRIVGGAGRDDLQGEGGNDTIDARDTGTSVDIVRCGGGRDTALVNRRDKVIGCEVVRRFA